MTTVRIADFSGEIPRVTPRLLPENASTLAINAYLDGGSILPFHNATTVKTLVGDAQTIYLRDAIWMSWDAVVNVAPGQIASDRIYFTGDGVPKLKTAAGATYDLALPAPGSAPSVSITGTADPETAESVVYVYTFLTDLDEESAPSKPTAILTLSPGQIVTLGSFSAPPAGRGVNRRRIYRSQTTELGSTTLFFVQEIPIASTSTSHDVTVEPLLEPISTLDYEPPPDDLTGLIALPNGIMAGFVGRELMFSEPYIPHAWPLKYRLKTDFEIVALSSFGSFIAVATKGTPYILQGSGPDNMTMEKVEAFLPCVSARGMVDLGYAAAYPSTAGLVLISQNGANIVTEGLFTRRQWQAMQPDKFRAVSWDGSYMFSFLSVDGHGGARDIGVIDTTGRTRSFSRLSEHAEALSVDGTSNLVYLLHSDDRTIKLVDDPAASEKTFSWKSKEFHFTEPQNFGVILIDPDNRYSTSGKTISAQVYANDQLVHTVTIAGTPQRLPSGFLAERWSIVLTGTMAIEAVSLAGSFTELAAAR